MLDIFRVFLLVRRVATEVVFAEFVCHSRADGNPGFSRELVDTRLRGYDNFNAMSDCFNILNIGLGRLTLSL
jgi:hypothetical protein